MRARRCLVLLGGLLCCAGAALRAGDAKLEHKVKAACLFKFLSFVEWPSEALGEAGRPLVVGVLGEDPFGALLEQTVGGRAVGGRKVEVRRYQDASAAREAHVLYVNLKGDALAEAMKKLEGSTTLTVGETSAFIGSGGVVRFAIRDEKVAFDIHPEAGRRARLAISSQLLKLARIVGSKGD